MEWIKVSDRLPEYGVEVLTLNYLREDLFQYRLDYVVCLNPDEVGDKNVIWACRLAADYDKVTHWMPLPDPPG